MGPVTFVEQVEPRDGVASASPFLPQILTAAAALFFHRRAPRQRFWTSKISTDGLELDGRGESCLLDGNGSVFQVEFQDSMSAPALEIEKGGEAQEAGDGQRYEMSYLQEQMAANYMHSWVPL
ncbi:hypothetical protein TRIUR3_20715 [Triticum urartu]|uniref:Uncharacterized protein n=1 Tax=Triticum urartu TaxID=4572 RepID=M7ZQY1_TRIUA|nr:hypothetical protein TRIUR3_20715 [Triticum urartu]